ncbi:NAD(P)H-binding protein [Aureimonas altamirensis]|uniref:NAD(P)H-binding protein n=1 Tax=Aureimonas altamirensis TaxID=370622 RepID=UPI001E378250|nr:NAD(P)H-binding protein [Aureimonas altamirensis]UHD45833.1 NAD(P)H-binding protein [Aureimonas altamirensis]
MNVFIVGIGSGVGRRVGEQLAAAGDAPTGLVRQQRQLETLASSGLKPMLGDLVAMSVGALADAIRGSDAVVFSAGAGGKDGDDATTRIDGDGPGKLAEAAALAGVRRFVLVSVFPEAWRERHMDASFEHYMVQKKRAEIALVQTDLDWLIVRPSALLDDPGTGRVDLGLAKVHETITRDDVATTMVELLRSPDLNRLILEVTGGDIPIADAVAAVRAATAPTGPNRA